MLPRGAAEPAGGGYAGGGGNVGAGSVDGSPNRFSVGVLAVDAELVASASSGAPADVVVPAGVAPASGA